MIVVTFFHKFNLQFIPTFAHIFLPSPSHLIHYLNRFCGNTQSNNIHYCILIISGTSSQKYTYMYYHFLKKKVLRTKKPNTIFEMFKMYISNMIV